jgi:hypothetical protein
MSNRYCVYNHEDPEAEQVVQAFDVTKLTCLEPIQKTIPGQSSTYYDVPLRYNYGTPENPLYDEFLMEWPEVDSRYGITENTNQQGRIEFSIMVSFPPTDKMKTLLAKHDEIYFGCAQLLQQIRTKVKKHNFNGSDINMAKTSGLKEIIYYPRDEATGELKSGKNPSCFLKLYKRTTKSSGEEKTLFTQLTKKLDASSVPVLDNEGNPVWTSVPIDWSLLKNVEMKFIPLVHYKRIYVGNTLSIQCEVRSAVVTSVRSKNSESIQTFTMKRLIDRNADSLNLLNEQLAKLSADRQSTITPVVKAQATTEEQSTEQQKVQGPSSEDSVGSMQPITKSGNPHQNLAMLLSTAPSLKQQSTPAPQPAIAKTAVVNVPKLN